MRTISIISALLVSAVFAAEDPFVRAGVPAPAKASQAAEPPLLSMTYEAFSISLEQAAALQRKNPGDTEFYNELVARVARGEAKQESIMIIRGRSGQKLSAESISETIYPTEYSPGAIAKGPGEQAARVPKPGERPVPALEAPVLPVAFETRNCGLAIEVEPTLSQDQQIADLRLAPEHVTFVGREKWGQGISETEMPLIDSQQLNTGVSTFPGLPCLLGTITKPQIPRPEENSARRIWFAFMTVDIVKN